MFLFFSVLLFECARKDIDRLAVSVHISLQMQGDRINSVLSILQNYYRLSIAAQADFLRVPF